MVNRSGNANSNVLSLFVPKLARILPRMALVALSILAIPATAQTYGFVSKWGSAGTGNGQFNAPSGAATDSAGNVYVADTANNSIQKFNATGTFALRFGNTGAVAFRLTAPAGVAVDSVGGIVYVADGNNHRIQRYNSTTGASVSRFGSSGTANGQFNTPGALALDSALNLYVADTGNNRIQKFNSTGAYVTKWGTPGTGNGQFISPSGIAVDSSGNVYVMDRGNNRVQKFTSTGTYVAQWGASGTGNGQFGAGARHLALDSSANVFVVDTGNNRIQKFSSTGTYLTQFGSFGATDGLFNAPRGVAVASTNYVYVSDTANNRIQRFGPLSNAPSSPGATPITTSAITFTWQDNSTDETGFKVYTDAGSAAPTTLRTTTAANATSWNWTGLAVNTQYAFQVLATNGFGDSAKTTNFTAWTLAATPLAPVLSGVTTTTCDVAIASGDGNPATTTYAIQNSESGLYVQADGTLGASAVYQTAAAWGTKTATGLSIDTGYSFVVIARNGASVNTGSGPAASTVTLAATPLAPLVTNAQVTKLDVAIAPGDGNPATTTYAILEVNGATYVQADGTLGASPVFQTAATWGTITVLSLDHSTIYNFAAIARNGASVQTAAGPSGTGTTLDGDNPTAHIITPLVSGPTNATSVSISVDFDHNVFNFNDASDLIIVHSGTSHTGLSITGGPQTYTVTLTGISGDGSFTLAVNTLSDVVDIDGLVMDSSVTSVPVVIDNTAPNALAPIPTTSGPTNVTSLDFAVDFDEPVQNFDDVSDLVITHTGTSHTGVFISGGPQNFTVSVTGIAGDGSCTLSVATASDVQDLVGNPLASALDSVPVSFLHSGPLATIGAPDPDTTSTGPVTFTVTYTGATSTSLDVSDIIVNATDSALAVVSVTGSGNTYTVTLSTITGDGTITISLAAGTAVDGVGNLAPATGPSQVLTVNNAPQLSLNLGIPFAGLMALVGVLLLRRKLAK